MILAVHSQNFSRHGCVPAVPAWKQPCTVCVCVSGRKKTWWFVFRGFRGNVTQMVSFKPPTVAFFFQYFYSPCWMCVGPLLVSSLCRWQLNWSFSSSLRHNFLLLLITFDCKYATRRIRIQRYHIPSGGMIIQEWNAFLFLPRYCLFISIEMSWPGNWIEGGFHRRREVTGQIWRRLQKESKWRIMKDEDGGSWVKFLELDDDALWV